MPTEVLTPSFDLLREEYVLVQAWKKTAAYIRSHNWYADTLALDRAAVDLPEFLSDMARRLAEPEGWRHQPLRIVPAPKSQRWRVDSKSGQWQPVDKQETPKKLRPLAHADLRDQVVATALLLCLADRVETAQGDPQRTLGSAAARRLIVSYGNRLFCDADGSVLRHRWGSGKLYRSYFADYRRFLARPEAVAEQVGGGSQIVVVQSDLRQFYDRVSPALLTASIEALREPPDDPRFFDFASRFFSWGWHQHDRRYVNAYAAKAGLTSFSQVALPQGLVASGFFANLVLLGFDQRLRDAIGTRLIDGCLLHDACRYVDDIRLVVAVEGRPDLVDLEQRIGSWLADALNQTAPGLELSTEKTTAALFRGDERPLSRQSLRMERIQHAISGGFDAVGGEEILNSIHGLVKAQTRYAKDRIEEQGWALSPVPDVRDETVARFAAGRFRSTFRSLRPLLDGEDDLGSLSTVDSLVGGPRRRQTRAELDDDARTFALGLIENWVNDPSNVRLLRIGLDLWPDAQVLRRVIEILGQYTTVGGGRKAPRRVAWYCLSEVFRAGATETGFVEDDECLPSGLDLAAYRAVLIDEAKRLADLPSATIPWYLRQQLFLFLAAHAPEQAPVVRSGRSAETKEYRQILLYLQRQRLSVTDKEFGAVAILARRCFLDRSRAALLVSGGLTPRRVESIAGRDPAFALELLVDAASLVPDLTPRLRDDLCLTIRPGREGTKTLADVVRDDPASLRSEPSLLSFVDSCLADWPESAADEAITPSDVLFVSRDRDPAEAQVVNTRVSPEGSMYSPPSWCPPRDRWRLQLGYLLRYVLSMQADFTRPVKKPSWRERSSTYRAIDGHWFGRRYALFSSHSAFGDDALPVSDWFENLLVGLLAWPGARVPRVSEWIAEGRAVLRLQVQKRIQELKELRGEASGLVMLPIAALWPDANARSRPLHVAIIQTVIPSGSHFSGTDLTLSTPSERRLHRSHLSAALAALERLLHLRATHRGGDGRLDLLVLPELSVHPRDVNTHLVPFVRAHRAVVLAGLTYEEHLVGQPLINSALWLIPVWSAQTGFQVMRRRQGKEHLAPAELKLNEPVARLQGFRPCQWLVDYRWDGTDTMRPLRLTASVCYDATDIRLAADLRDRSDVFIVPALNQDVPTFDQMAQALHYHMYQLVIVANNGSFGGSNAYAPFSLPYVRQVFHLHGQPQASIAFLEIDPISEFIRRGPAPPAGGTTINGSAEWKYPPAGFKR